MIGNPSYQYESNFNRAPICESASNPNRRMQLAASRRNHETFEDPLAVARSLGAQTIPHRAVVAQPQPAFRRESGFHSALHRSNPAGWQRDPETGADLSREVRPHARLLARVLAAAAPPARGGT